MDHSYGSEGIPPPVPPDPAHPEGPRSPERLWLALTVGLALAVPAGWLLSLLALLPKLLGLFFFLVAGLIIGAVMYRAALPAAPAPRPRLYFTGFAVAFTLWLSALVVEYRSLPELAFKTVRGTMQFSLSPERKEHIQDTLRGHIEAKLKANYPPGGLIGYMRWAARSGDMVVPRVIDNTSVRFQFSQRRGWWIVRAGLSLVFLCGAILSQMLALGPTRPVEVNTQDSEAPAGLN